ncbi:hypothetical protein DPMN_108739 [Dreissena polymorpha]|uniref:Uncharacterized protein n=1 Tax=Dreissena polymorpha TaxID=45954 RepID=A0A9D4QMC7_DREPO|nr:hypothetical protein DPMN_108726 [Dreissena polymorpha]KAH3835393.1 hypothetical protein DPMN_108739 [Dreissena polymorpha]
MLISTIYSNSTYMVLTTSTVRPGAVLRIAVHFLSPVSGETVTAELLSDTNVTLVRTKFSK